MASLSGFAGASALVAGNVHVSTTDGLPTIKGIAARQNGQKAEIEGGVFAGVRGGCEVSGELRWRDVLTEVREWDKLCGIGKKVEAAFGAGAEFNIRLHFSETTGKFYCNAHAGLVLGAGAAGSFLLEVETQKILRMLHFVYNALMEVDFRYLELFDQRTSAFDWYQRMSLYALCRGLTAVDAATEFAVTAMDYIRELVNEVFVSRKREREGAELAKNIVKDINSKEFSVFLHSPPEVKGVVLDNILYDWWATPQAWSNNDIKVQAVTEIVNSFQGWRDFEETLVRMNPEGVAQREEFDRNFERLFDFIGKTKSDQQLFIRGLKGQVAVAGRPVKMDPFNVCRMCSIG